MEPCIGWMPPQNPPQVGRHRHHHHHHHHHHQHHHHHHHHHLDQGVPWGPAESRLTGPPRQAAGGEFARLAPRYSSRTLLSQVSSNQTILLEVYFHQIFPGFLAINTKIFSAHQSWLQTPRCTCPPRWLQRYFPTQPSSSVGF